MLKYMVKEMSVAQAEEQVVRACRAGITAKGFFILGMVPETRESMQRTEDLIHRLWDRTKDLPAPFRASVFEFRPTPDSPEWKRLLKRGYTVDQLLDCSGRDQEIVKSGFFVPGRQAWSLSTDIQFSSVPLQDIRATMHRIQVAQRRRDGIIEAAA